MAGIKSKHIVGVNCSLPMQQNTKFDEHLGSSIDDTQEDVLLKES